MRFAAAIKAVTGIYFRNASNGILVAILCLAINLYFNIGFAQEPVNPSKVRIAYLYQFIRFIEWPAESTPQGAQAYTICVPNLSSEIEFLELITEKTVNGQTIDVRQVDLNDSMSVCQILYLAELKPHQQRQYIDDISGLPILSVGNGDRFLEAGGIIAFNLRKGQLTFSVNLKRASDANLKISANMLDVAEKVVK